jgi:solute carrier family 25 (mitochondrial oxoglutarate transporter), member 11
MKTLSGMCSGAIAVCIGTPFDVALVRMQADSMKPVELRRNYKNVFDAIGRIFREEGPKRLYAGLAPNVLRGMSMNVGMLACYDQAKDFIATSVTKDENPSKPSLLTNLLSSAVAGFTSAFFSLPFDLLKSRMQDMKPNAKGEMPASGLMDVSMTILRKEGVLAFWTGFPAYYGRCAPHAMIILMTIEQITALYKRVFISPKRWVRERVWGWVGGCEGLVSVGVEEMLKCCSRLAGLLAD